MDMHVSLTARGRFTTDVYRRLRAAILDGRLRPGEALPPSRELASRLSVSRNTVVNAYQQLIAEGFAAGRVGAGTFVTAPPPREVRRAPAGAVLQPRAIWRALSDAPPARPRPPVRDDFSVGSPDPALFPWDAWRSLVARQLRGRRPTVGYPGPEGDPRLRAAIARHVGLARSVRAGAEDVLVTSGAQQAFDLIGRVLIEPGCCVAVEDPGYPPAARVFRALGARVVAVRVDAEGIDVAALPADARLVYVTPSHQFPLGTAMSLARRVALLAWAERHGAAILEDDYDSEFRFGGRPLEPVHSLDRHGRVIYVGTFSKVLLPTLRLGFVIAPPSLMPALRTARSLADSHGAPEIQRALGEFIDDGMLARHIRRVVRIYAERRDALCAAVTRYLGGELALVPSAAGLHVAGLLRRGRPAHAVAERALAERIVVEPLDTYYAEHPRSGLVLGYGLIAAPRIDPAIRQLAACVAQQ